MSERNLRRRFWASFAWLTLGLGLAIVILRFQLGLGAVTNLSDQFPWGLWVGFDVLCGVGLAAGGFTITALVHLFHIRRLEPIVRPAVLTAFLGYVLVIVALVIDLGRPWNLWHPLVMWNPRSVMFEVSWCVMLYTAVLALEASGMLFEHLGWRRALTLQKAFTTPLVVAGVLLSTLHQSSLGAFYLLSPGKLHPLWYSAALPLLFWISSVAAGFAMVLVESRLSGRAFGRELEMPVQRLVGRMLLGALVVLALARGLDLAVRGVLAHVFDGTYEASLLQLEVTLGILLPIVLLSHRRWRARASGLWAAGLLTVFGFVIHRLNVSITGFEASRGATYIPAWTEIVVSLALVTAGFLAFRWVAAHLPVFPPRALARVPDRARRWTR